MPILNRFQTEDWNFGEEPQSLVLSSRLVLEDRQPVLVVSRDPDGNWRFLSGSEVSMNDVRFVTLDSIVALDPSLHRIAETPPGHTARREHVDAEWTVAPS